MKHNVEEFVAVTGRKVWPHLLTIYHGLGVERGDSTCYEFVVLRENLSDLAGCAYAEGEMISSDEDRYCDALYETSFELTDEEYSACISFWRDVRNTIEDIVICE